MPGAGTPLTRSRKARWLLSRAEAGGVSGPDLHSRRSRSSTPLLEALAAINRTTLSGLEGNRRFLPALRTDGGGLHLAVTRPPTQRCVALGLAGLAALRFVLEVLVRKKQLLPGGEDKLRTAIYALQDLVPVFHHFDVRSLQPNGRAQNRNARRAPATRHFLGRHKQRRNVPAPGLTNPWVPSVLCLRGQSRFRRQGPKNSP